MYLYNIKDLPNQQGKAGLSPLALSEMFGGYTRVLYNDAILVSTPEPLAKAIVPYTYAIIAGYSYDANDKPTGYDGAEAMRLLHSAGVTEVSWYATEGGWLNGRGELIQDRGWLMALNSNNWPAGASHLYKLTKLKIMAEEARTALGQQSVIAVGADGYMHFVEGFNHG